LALHVLVLACVLYRPSPKILSPSSVIAGAYGGSVTHLYWPSQPADVASHAARRRAHAKLVFHRRPKIAPTPPEIPDTNPAATEAKAANGPAAGTPYGSSEIGSSSGDEIRPALPVSTADPVVSQADMRNGSQGNEVVEITIDERGSIVNKIVLQSLGPAIDAKVLAALENWRFRPATRNGVAIPSKQDVYYHFPPQG
jgi:periplasmic protein TonB